MPIGDPMMSRDARRAIDSQERPLYQRQAIHAAQEARRQELAPLRLAVDDAICAIGWRRAKPIIEEVMGFPVKSQRGPWWSKVGKRKGAALLEALRAPEPLHEDQKELF